VGLQKSYGCSQSFTFDTRDNHLFGQVDISDNAPPLNKMKQKFRNGRLREETTSLHLDNNRDGLESLHKTEFSRICQVACAERPNDEA